MKKLRKTLMILPLLLLQSCTDPISTDSGKNDHTSTASVSTSAPITTSVPQPSGEKDVKELQIRDLTDFSFNAYSDAFRIEGSSSVKQESNVYTIQNAGTYTISGNLNGGQVVVKKNVGAVKIILNNVSIKGTTAAIEIKSGNTATIEVKEGTKNYLDDGESKAFEEVFASDQDDEPKGTLFSKSDLVIEGSGELYIISEAEGISYTDVSTKVTTTEAINAIQVKKSNLTINDSSIYIKSVSNGIKVKGITTISKAKVEIKSANDAIDCDYNEDISSDNTTGAINLAESDLIIESERDGLQSGSSIKIDSGLYSIKSGGGSKASGNSSTESYKGIKTSNSDTNVNNTITINGGEIHIDSYDDALHSDNDIYIEGGVIVLKTADDGLHADTNLVIENNDPQIIIHSSYEGLEAHDITIECGFIYLKASDDGINAAGGNDSSSTIGPRFGKQPQARGGWGGGMGPDNPGTTDDACLTIDGGYIVVDAEGDGIDANGEIHMTDGTVIVNGPVSGGNNAIDYDNEFSISGGTFIATGTADMMQAPSSTSTSRVIQAGTSAVNSNSYYAILDDNSEEILVFKLSKQSSSIVFSSPDLKASAKYSLFIDGEYSGGSCSFGICTGGSYSGGKNAGSVTLNSIINTIGGR